MGRETLRLWTEDALLFERDGDKVRVVILLKRKSKVIAH